MKFIFAVSFLFIIMILIPACSSSMETTTETKEEKVEDVYVFDEIPEPKKIPESTYQAPKPPYYVVQIGAFTDKHKADTFASESRNLLNNEIEVRYSNSVNLYVVQVIPYFTSRPEAESLRNKLWTMDGYRDAWIVTVK